MEVEKLDKYVTINFNHKDDYYYNIHGLSEDNHTVNSLHLSLSLDRAIDLEKELHRITQQAIKKLNEAVNNES